MAPNGFVALATLDTNGNGSIDGNDDNYTVLRVWKDADNDGETDAGELLTLQEAGVASISLSYTNQNVTDANGNQHLQAGSYLTTSGATRTINDVWFKVDTARTIDKDLVTVSAEISALPDISGYGNVHSLHQAMARDTTGHLKDLVQQFIAATDVASRDAIVTNLIYVWAGVEAVDPASRAATQIYGNAIGDARKLEALEEFLGQEYLGTWCWDERDPNPHGPAAKILLSAFSTLTEYVSSQLLAQTTYKAYFESIGMSWNATTERFDFDVADIVSAFNTIYVNNAVSGVITLSDFANILNSFGDFGDHVTAAMRASGTVGASGFLGLLAQFGLTSTIGDGLNNYLYGSDVVNDYIAGLGGDDDLYARSGDDTLVGGAGNDYLVGENGADSYVFAQGFGHDIIFNSDSDTPESKPDKIIFDASISSVNIDAKRVGFDLVLTHNYFGAADTITIYSYFDADGAPSSSYAVETIQFADGTVWDVAAVKARVLAGTAGNDYIAGYASADNLSGLDGSDTIHGWDGSDTLTGGTGQDLLYGDNGDDVVKGDGGNDTLYGYNGNDSLEGGTGNDTLYGEAGNDTLDGGAGNDYLSGNVGADVYLFGKGYGQDWLYNYDSDTQGTNADKVLLGAGVLTTDVTLTRTYDDLILKINGTDDQLTIQSYFYNEGVGNDPVETIQFADGTVWDVAAVKARVLAGTAGNDYIAGYASADNLSGLDGNDTIHGWDGSDTLTGGTGQDLLYGDNGDDVVKGDGGNDTLYGYNGNDSLEGGTGNDTLYGEAGNDTLDGGAGNDYLSGNVGADVYLFGKGYGQDWLYNYDSDTQGTNADKVLLGAGVLTTDVTLTRTYDDLILKINGTDDQLTIQSYFYNEGVGNDPVETIQFADGTVWDVAAVKARVLAGTAGNDYIAGYASADNLSGLDGNDTIHGWDGSDTLTGGTGQDLLYGDNGDDVVKGDGGNDTLYGYNGNDSLEGGTGNDTLYGEAGNDTLDGGAGNDYLSGNVGADVYLFGRGYGQDWLYNYDSDTQGTNADKVLLGAGVLTTDVTLTRTYDDLILTINGTADQLTIQSYFYYEVGNDQVETIQFADGTVWDVAAVKARVTTIVVPGSVSRYGTDSADNLAGGSGNDLLYGYAGNDTLDGGAGNDTLDGGVGNDTYLFGLGSGKDTINAYESTIGKIDVIQLGAGVLTTGVTATRNGNSLVLSLNGTSDALEVSSYFNNEATGGYQAEQVKFADGTIWDTATIKTKVLAGTVDNDSIAGYATADNLSGLDGNDTLHGWDGNDTLTGGSDQDLLFGDYGDDIVKGDGGNDTLYGYYGNDSLEGGTGNDTLYGEAGNDTQDGGAGNDTLDGGVGNDTYLFGLGAGKDTISAYESTVGKIDVIQLGAGVLATGVTATRNGSSLVLSLNGTSDALEVSSYFNNDATGGYQVEQVKFSDGTIWDTATIKTKVLAGTVDNDSIAGYATADNLSGLDGNDTLHGWDGNDTLTGGSDQDLLFGDYGDDIVKGDGGNDTLYGYYGNDSLEGGTGNDTLYGEAGNDSLNGGAGNDTLTGDAGNDTLDGGTGVDSMDGGDGNDIYFVRDTGDVVTEANANAAVGGTDQVNSALANYTLGANLENGRILHTGAANLLGNELNNVLYAGAGNNILNGGAGSDTASYQYATAAVTLNLSVTGAQATGSSGSDTLANIKHLTGSNYADTLTGNSVANTLNGGAGADTLAGGLGDDTYYVDHAGDVITEALNAGTDLAISSYLGTYVLGANVENGRITATGAASLAGNGANNLLYAGAGNNSLDGSSGTDTVSYQYATAAVTVSLAIAGAQATGGSGLDTLVSIENLVGSNYNDSLTGSNGDNTLDGGLGNDTLAGGLGNDSYAVNSTLDIVTEGLNAGMDQVNSALANYTLGANLENGRILHTGAANLLGNELNNILYAGAGNNILNGGAGSDTASYQYATAAVTLNLSVTGAQATGSSGSDTLANIQHLTGSNYADTLTGNSVANTLNGGAGADTMAGGDASDIYHVDNVGDVVTETNAAAAGGIDTVCSSLNSYSLKDNVENGRITAAGPASITGNGLNNVLYAGTGDNTLDGGTGVDTASYLYGTAGVTVSLATTGAQATGGSGTDTLLGIEYLTGSNYNDSLTGSAIVNILTGGTGNDTLAGGLGNDLLVGGAGQDLFVFDSLPNATSNKDTLNDFSVADDTLQLENAIFTALAAGTVAADSFLSGAGLSTAADANDFLIYNTTTGALFYDPDGLGASAAIQFATLSTHPALSAGDFVVG